jgi:hypothetical protein
MEAKRGDIRFYHEAGCRWRVEVLDAKRKDEGNTKGEEYRLKILEVISESRFGDRPEIGLEFSVWRAENTCYAGWHLLER